MSYVPLHGTFLHYHMQLGSGTWDFRPSLTYLGHLGRLSWGGQLSGTKRMEDENESGFAFGDNFQATAWGSYSVLDWLSDDVNGFQLEREGTLSVSWSVKF